eukprot:475395-Amphidinium_carterae.3
MALLKVSPRSFGCSSLPLLEVELCSSLVSQRRSVQSILLADQSWTAMCLCWRWTAMSWQDTKKMNHLRSCSVPVKCVHSGDETRTHVVSVLAIGTQPYLYVHVSNFGSQRDVCETLRTLWDAT